MLVSAAALGCTERALEWQHAQLAGLRVSTSGPKRKPDRKLHSFHLIRSEELAVDRKFLLQPPPCR